MGFQNLGRFLPLHVVNKGWGREVIFASTECYAGKLLEFQQKGSKMSLHFHKVKDETWYVLKGHFDLTILDFKTSKSVTKILAEGESLHIPPMMPHRLECRSDGGTILEVSIHDDPEDNYRIAPGDSQNA